MGGNPIAALWRFVRRAGDPRLRVIAERWQRTLGRDAEVEAVLDPEWSILRRW